MTLNQKDFIAKIVKEITNNKGRKQVILECTTCSAEFVKYTAAYKRNQGIGECPKCSRKTASLKMTQHGDSLKTSPYYRLHRIFIGMTSRCYNVNKGSYANYGALGVYICDAWRSNYLSFKEWSLANGYANTLSIDRIDPNGPYSPTNCRWATVSTQAANKRVLMSTNKSGYRGVSWNEAYSKWEASIGIDKQTVKIGYYTTRLEGAKAYDTYILDHSLDHTSNGVLDNNERVEQNTGKLLIATNTSGYVGVNSPKRLAANTKKHATKVEYKGQVVFSGYYASKEEAAYHRDAFLRTSSLYNRTKKNFTTEQFVNLQKKYLTS